MNHLFKDLAVLFLAGGIAALIFKKFKLPAIIGFLFAGFIISPSSFFSNIIDLDKKSVQYFSDIGVVLLLFSIGMETGLQKIKNLGFIPIFIGLIETLFLWLIATQSARIFNYNMNTTLFIGATLCISSTTVAIRNITENKLNLTRAYETLIGILIVEDLIAIFLLTYLPTLNGQSNDYLLYKLFINLILNVFIWWFMASIIGIRLVNYAQKIGGEEVLLIISIGLCLLLSAIAEDAKFSAALGAFIMGAVLADSRQINKIEELTKPLKMLFGILFFVSYGMMLNFEHLLNNYIFIFSLLVVFFMGKLFISFICSFLFGYNTKDSFIIGVSLTAVGEFSFIIADTGNKLNILSYDIFSSLILLSCLSIIISSFSSKYLYQLASKIDYCIPNKIFIIYNSYIKTVQKISIWGKSKQYNIKFYDYFKKNIKEQYRLLTPMTTSSTLKRLAPEAEYLSEIGVNFVSDFIGKTLLELNVRQNYNVNIVAIEREYEILISPDPQDKILPKDKLLIYGVEEDILFFEKLCNKENQINLKNDYCFQDCELVVILVSKEHEFINKSIKELDLRKRKQSTILLIENDKNKIKNPPADYIIVEGDLLTIVGPKQLLKFYLK